jgi:catechol 2,3-dioxygenase-like lactoylglutathione lyase family enzyme
VKILGIDHVQLAMPRGREDDARAFYGDLLLMAELPKPANLAARGGVWFEAGDRKIHVGVEDDFRPAKKAHPALRVEDLDAFRSRLAEGGYAPYEDEPLPGYRRFYVAGPFGNRLEFLEPVATATAPASTEEQREAARRLARLGGSQPHLKPIPRRRPPYR